MNSRKCDFSQVAFDFVLAKCLHLNRQRLNCLFVYILLRL
jgi:hypothetical protein